MKRPTIPLTPGQQFQNEIVAALKKYHGEGYKPIRKRNICFANSHEKLTVEQVTQAATAMASALDFPGGTELYKIVQVALLDKEKYEEILVLLKGWIPPSKAFG